MMSDMETTGLAFISDTAANLPAPVSTGLLKAMSSMLGGLTAIPTAWLKRPAQAAEDTTAARSTVAAILARGVGEEALKDPVLMQAAAEIYLPTAVRKAESRVRVMQRAVEHASETAADGVGADAPDDDWMNAFMRFAEDASSEKLQDIFGRILAGQVVRPGSFSLATLRAVAELDQSIAQDFSLVWAKSVGEAVDSGPEFRRGDWFSRWKRLAEAGLMAVTATTQFLPPHKSVTNGNALWSPMNVNGTYLLVHFPKRCAAKWEHIEFTRIGRQIGSILAPPDYRANMREAGKRLAPKGVARVELHSTGNPIELLYAAPQS